MIRFGPALVVIAVGATLAFAVSPTTIPGLNLTAAGIIILLVGVVALLLSARAGGASYRTMSARLRPTLYVRHRGRPSEPDAPVDGVVVKPREQAGQPRR